NIALLQVSTVQISGRVGPGTELEQHRRQPQLRDRGGHRLPLGGQFLEGRANEDADPLIGGSDHDAGTRQPPPRLSGLPPRGHRILALSSGSPASSWLSAARSGTRPSSLTRTDDAAPAVSSH